jgi:NTE family protein
MQPNPTSDIKRALVLSGGGARGAFHIGVWRYLQEIGWDPDLICGTSVGGLNAAAIGSEMPLENLARIWRTHRRTMMVRLQALRFVGALLFRRPFRPVFDTGPLRTMIQRYLDIPALRNSRRDIMIAAVDVSTASVALFDQHTIGVDHLMATSAIPVLFPWQRLGDKTYWDGCVSANTPLFAALNSGAQEIVEVLLSPVGQRPQPLPENAIRATEMALEHFLIGSRQISGHTAGVGDGYGTNRPRVFTVAPQRMLGFWSLLSFSKRQAARLIREGYWNSRRQLGHLIG